MGRFMMALAIASALTLPAVANDSGTELRAGGIEPVRTRLAGDGANAAYMWEQNLSYTLITANNWAGMIGNFTLTVDKGYEDSLVSFCGDGVTKLGSTIFEMTAEDYYPAHDLDILFLRLEG